MTNQTLANRLAFCLFVLVGVSLPTGTPAVGQIQETENNPPTAVVQGTDKDTDGAQEKLTPANFHRAARNGDLARVKSALKQGIDVNAKSDYGATALFFACDRGQEEVVAYLLEQGADPNVKDSFYDSTPTTWAMMKGNQPIILNLLKNGGKEIDQVLLGAVGRGDVEFTGQVLDLKRVDEKTLIKARDAARKVKDEEKRTQLIALFEPFKLPETKSVSLSKEVLAKYQGNYANENLSVEISIVDEIPMISFNGNAATELVAVSQTEFSVGGGEIRFKMGEEKVDSLVCKFGDQEFTLAPRKEAKESTPDPTPPPKSAVAESKPPADAGPSKSDLEIASANWPGFRGNGSRGIAEGQSPPLEFHVGGESESNFLWKTPVAGLGLSCPTIWDDRIYLTTAESEGDAGAIKIGLYGDVESVEDDNEYEFKLLCFSKSNGKMVWERTANKAKPAVKRHGKSSHANPTVATNGKQVVAFFGSEGLYCYSQDGDLIWKRDLGFLDSGWFYDPDYQWGFGSSPVIYQDRVIVQCDVQGQSFIAAYDLKTGDEIWRTDREEIPTWSSPIVHEFDDLAMLITNGTKAARAYDVKNGELLWSLKGHSEIVVPTPSVAKGLIFVSSGYSPIRPIYAIKPDARGDISLPKDTNTNEAIPWSVKRGGPYMPSPIVYGDYLYCCANSGVLTCYVATTGEVVYKKRMTADGGSLAFTASPLAADGHLYFTAEDGRVLVVKSGAEFELVNVSEIGESILATPAISNGAMYFRTQNSLIAVGGVSGNQ